MIADPSNLGNFMIDDTPDFLFDTRRGLYSYEALQSRLAQNSFAGNGLVDHSGPVLRLANLSPENFYVLLIKLRHVYAGGDPAAHLVPDEALVAAWPRCTTEGLPGTGAGLCLRDPPQACSGTRDLPSR